MHIKLANALGIKRTLTEKFKKSLSDNEENRKNCNQIISSKNPVEYFVVLQTGPDTCQIRFDLEKLDSIKKKAFFFFKMFPEPIVTPKCIS